MSGRHGVGHDGLSVPSDQRDVTQLLADAFGGSASDYLLAGSGAYRRVYFDFTAATAQDWTADASGAWVPHTLTDQSGTSRSIDARQDNGPTTWGIVSGVGLRIAGASNLVGRVRFAPANVGIDLQGNAWYARWGYTREGTQDVGAWGGITLEPASGSADYLRANVDYRSATTTYGGEHTTRRASSSIKSAGLHAQAAAYSSVLQELRFAAGAYRISEDIDAGTTRPSDVGLLTERTIGSHENRGVSLADPAFGIATIDFRFSGQVTVKWLEFLIALSEVS